MTVHNFTIFLVDDEPCVLAEIGPALEAAGYHVKPFTSAQDFILANDPEIVGCALIDLLMPKIDGLQLQQFLIKNKFIRPVIFLTGTGGVPETVKAIKAGAIDVLTKPVELEALFSAIARAVESDAYLRQTREEVRAISCRLATLTRREREVLEYVLAGQINKQIAVKLGTVEKTIKVHRGRMMKKLGTRSIVHLVRMTQCAGIEARFS